MMRYVRMLACNQAVVASVRPRATALLFGSRISPGWRDRIYTDHEYVPVGGLKSFRITSPGGRDRICTDHEYVPAGGLRSFQMPIQMSMRMPMQIDADTNPHA